MYCISPFQYFILFFFNSYNCLSSALETGGETASSVIRRLPPLGMPFGGPVSRPVPLSSLSLFWSLVGTSPPPEAIPDHPLSEGSLSKVRPCSVLSRTGREMSQSEVGGTFCSCSSSLCNVQAWGRGGTPWHTPVSCRDSLFLPPAATSHQTARTKEAGREESHGCEILQIRKAAEMSSYLRDCIPPNHVSNSPCSSCTLPSWSQAVEDGVSRPAAPFPPIYRQLLLFLFAPLMYLLTVSSPSSLQGVHEREGAEGGPAAEQHPLPQRLLCQLGEGRVGWCCHLAMG